jgi:hypothetical protein
MLGKIHRGSTMRSDAVERKDRQAETYRWREIVGDDRSVK